MCVVRKRISLGIVAKSDQYLLKAERLTKALKLPPCRQRSLIRLVDAPADLSLRWALMPICRFCSLSSFVHFIGRESACRAVKILNTGTPKIFTLNALKMEQFVFHTALIRANNAD